MIGEGDAFTQGWMDLVDEVEAAGAGTDVMGVLGFGEGGN